MHYADEHKLDIRSKDQSYEWRSIRTALTLKSSLTNFGESFSLDELLNWQDFTCAVSTERCCHAGMSSENKSLAAVDRESRPYSTCRHMHVPAFKLLLTYLISRSYYFRYQQISKKLFPRSRTGCWRKLCVANCGQTAADISDMVTIDNL